jgi:hypothetical protein
MRADHLPASHASAAAHETAAERQARFHFAIPEFWKLVQTCSQVAPFAVGFADGQASLTMFAQTVAQVADGFGVGVGGHDASENAKRMGMRMRFIDKPFAIGARARSDSRRTASQPHRDVRDSESLCVPGGTRRLCSHGMGVGVSSSSSL